MKTFFLLLFTSLLLSCSKHLSSESESLAITFESTFSESSKSTATSFEASDKIGLYGLFSGQSFRSSGNLFNNNCFVVQDDGSIVGSPSAAYYPSSKSSLAFYAYYPYSADVADATKFAFAVQSDQSAVSDLAKSDLCYAAGIALPSSSAYPLHFSHKLSRVIFNVTVPTALTVTSLRLLDVSTGVNMDISTGILTSTSTRGDLTSTAVDFILPGQTFSAAKAILSVLVSDGREFLYTPTSDVTLLPGKITSFTLTLNDNLTATLSKSIAVEPWTTGSFSGDISQGVNNSFTAHWLLPNPAYKTITQATLSVYNLLTKKTVDYPCGDFALITDQGPGVCSYRFSFEPSSVDLSYPYRIDTVKFYDNSTKLVQKCVSLISANVYKSGAYTLGLNQDNVLDIRSGTVNNWGDMDINGELKGSGVSNSFRLQLIDATYAYQNITRVGLTIGGKQYTFDGLSLLEGSTQFLATSSTFGFPDASGFVPNAYPYTISSVDLYNSAGDLLDSKFTTIEVSRGGMISLQCYRGGIIALAGSLVDWGDANGSGTIIGSGTKNTFTLSLIDTPYPLSAVSSVRFISDKKAYKFTGIAFDGGNQFLATTKPFRTPDSEGAFPSRYPFTITRVDVLDAAGLVLQSSEGSIEVYDTLKKVTLQIYKNNLALTSTTTVGDWTPDASSGDIGYGGVLGSNLITLYYSDALATNVTPCTSATKMTLFVGGKGVSLTVTMKGTGSAAFSATPVDIQAASPAVNLPSRYPYFVDSIALYDNSNKVLINRKFKSPVPVLAPGVMTLRVVR